MLPATLALTAALLGVTHQNPSVCKKPSAQALVGQSLAAFSTVTAKSFSVSGRELQWVAVSWSNPPGGRLFVVNCKGLPLAHSDSFGYVTKLQIGPALNGQPSLIIEFVPGSGTGLQVSDVAITSFRRGGIKQIWRHSLVSIEDTGDILRSEKYKWNFCCNMNEIAADGVVEIKDSKSLKKQFIHEKFIYNVSMKKFLKLSAPTANRIN